MKGTQRTKKQVSKMPGRGEIWVEVLTVGTE